MDKVYPKIVRTGSYAPDEVLTNKYFAEKYGLSEEKIFETIGIRERRRASLDLTVGKMAAIALEKCFDNEITPSSLDFIIVATNSNHRKFPPAASDVQKTIGLGTYPPFYDVSGGCSSFNLALYTAGAYIRSGDFRTVAVVGSDTMTRFNPLREQDRTLFGDGAGAVILQASETPGLINPPYMKGDASKGGLIHESYSLLEMEGPEVLRWASRVIVDACEKAFEPLNYSLRDVKWFLIHQANIRIRDKAVKIMARKIEVEEEELKRRFLINIESYGNTSAASIPSLLDQNLRNGTIKEGDLCAMVGFGAGLLVAVNPLIM